MSDIDEAPKGFYESPQETAARALLAVLYPDYSKRWNVEVSKDGITFCDGYHEKGHSCDHDVIYIRRKSAPMYRHKKRGSVYQDIGTGELQVEPNTILKDGDKLKAYVDNENRLWFRTPQEFHDGRFERVFDLEAKAAPNDGLSADITKVANLPNIVPGSLVSAVQVGMSEETKTLLAWAKHWNETATDEEKEAMFEIQKKNYARGGPFGPTDDMGTVVVPCQLVSVDDRLSDLTREDLLNAMWKAHRLHLDPNSSLDSLTLPKGREDLRELYGVMLDAIANAQK